MRTPNTECEICKKPLYRRPYELETVEHVCCKGCRSELYKKYPKYYKAKGLEKGRAWNKGKSKANGDKLIYGKPRSSKTKKLISEAMTGREFTEEHRKAISEARIRLFDEIGRIGKSERGWQWARWRRAIYKRDKKTCQVCGETEDTIYAHHILSWKDYPELRYKLSNGICLCRSCHLKLHKHRKRNLNIDILRQKQAAD